jgi:ELWxxDGT repeat protein
VSSTPVPAPTFLVLAANDGVSGIELWRTDGTAGGTVQVKDINANPGASSFPGEGGTLFPSEFVFFNGVWFFSADDGVTGPELWKSDGTAVGTMRVKDINPSSGAGSSPKGFTVFNNALYFSASDGGTGVELWRTDGTEGGTVRVKDIAPGVGSVGGILAPLSSSPSGFTVFNNALYFSADDGRTGRELWKTDGTDAGTMQVKDLCPGSCSGLPFLVILSVRNEALRPTNH